MNGRAPDTEAWKGNGVGLWEKCRGFSLLSVLHLKEEVLEGGEGDLAGSGTLGYI